MGTGVPPWGPPPHPGPVVHSDGWTALHYAAINGNRRIVRSLVDADADVHAQDCNGCAVCASGESAVECAGRVAAAVGRAGGRRCTGPRPMAILRPSRSCCCAAPTGPSRTTSTGTAALRRTAETEDRKQPRARRHTPKRAAEICGRLAQYEAGESQVHSACRVTAPAHSAPHPSPRCWCRRMCRRCSPSALADPAGRGAHTALAL